MTITRKQKGAGAGNVAHFPGLFGVVIFFYAFLYLPIVVLISYSFNSGSRSMVWKGFSFSWYGKVFNNDAILSAAENSLIIGLIATAFATTIATAGALALARGGSFKGKSISMGLITLPLVVPEIVTAVAPLMFFASIKMNLGLGNLIIAHTVFCIPFAFMPIRARLEGMDSTLEQAARDLYSTEWQAFRFITLPLLMPGIIAGATLAFVISLDDFIISMMVSTAGTTTLPVYIYSMIRQGVSPEVNAVSTVLFAISIGLITIYWFASKPGK
jgi:spermidine/putrescine transport system permease protein